MAISSVGVPSSTCPAGGEVKRSGRKTNLTSGLMLGRANWKASTASAGYRPCLLCGCCCCTSLTIQMPHSTLTAHLLQCNVSCLICVAKPLTKVERFYTRPGGIEACKLFLMSQELNLQASKG
ncbi:uncharacterized protein LOC123510007 [Portunus trituberculatus]|uniref:uncharacterized protein LOC123510007 n=1 Tax=Portunus trituberculatus TaxID=210409 RepID=UPI001E1CB90E|nr:uncharacterized protein LOC123510007 [Portunus trituberculatus]